MWFGSLDSEDSRGPYVYPRSLTTGPANPWRQPVDSSRPLIQYIEEVGTRIEGVHFSHNLGCMLPLSSPGEAGPPSVQDLVEGASEGEGEGAMEEGASARPGDQDRGELLQHGLEVASAESHVVKGERNQAAGG